ncbi:hypothetical protein I2F17_02625 [Acinetobacter sp. B10A]|uniref:hypothetical protein n=1 Tax=Acinetobacter baretiae TaxID=2605383 RepID=UPI001B3C764D|nr:hypothetical protein [Acinetobacter baretiae]MBF7684730.1 hypothetical protein [Acinetobacter baretiae]
MDKKTLTRRVNLIRYLGFFIIILIVYLVFLDFRALGFNRANIKDNGAWMWVGAFYFLMSTHYLKYLKNKYEENIEILGKQVILGTILTIIFSILMIVTIWIKA